MGREGLVPKRHGVAARSSCWACEEGKALTAVGTTDAFAGNQGQYHQVVLPGLRHGPPQRTDAGLPHRWLWSLAFPTGLGVLRGPHVQPMAA